MKNRIQIIVGDFQPIMLVIYLSFKVQWQSDISVEEITTLSSTERDVSYSSSRGAIEYFNL